MTLIPNGSLPRRSQTAATESLDGHRPPLQRAYTAATMRLKIGRMEACVPSSFSEIPAAWG
jgi:hypothetical protein